MQRERFSVYRQSDSTSRCNDERDTNRLDECVSDSSKLRCWEHAYLLVVCFVSSPFSPSEKIESDEWRWRKRLSELHLILRSVHGRSGSSFLIFDLIRNGAARLPNQNHVFFILQFYSCIRLRLLISDIMTRPLRMCLSSFIVKRVFCDYEFMNLWWLSRFMECLAEIESRIIFTHKISNFQILGQFRPNSIFCFSPIYWWSFSVLCKTNRNEIFSDICVIFPRRVSFLCIGAVQMCRRMSD